MAYTITMHGRRSSDAQRAWTLECVVAYIRAWTKLVRAEAHDGRSVRELCTFRVNAHGHDVATVHVYAHVVCVQHEDDAESDEYEYMYAALADLNPPDPADADDADDDDDEGYDVEEVRMRFADEDQREKHLRSAEFRELCESLRCGPRCDDEEL